MNNHYLFSSALPSSEVILNNMSDGIIILDESSTILYVNPSAEKIFHKTAADLSGTVFGYPIDSQGINEIRVIYENKVKTIHMLATAIQWEGREACLLSLRDVSEMAGISKELEKKKARLEMTNKELEQYASLASHDLKEPVRKVSLYANRVLHQYPDIPGPAKEFLKKICQSADRMQNLIAGIAEFSKVEHVQANFAQVNLNQVLKEVLQDLDLKIAEKRALISSVPLPVIEAVPVQMHQLFLNLVSNALKYSQPGLPPEISIYCEEDDEWAIISVADNGIGFNNRMADKIFQPFHRLHKNEIDGTGIGLAICKKIVEVHGGKIQVNSMEGQGSTFRFSLAKWQDTRRTWG